MRCDVAVIGGGPAGSTLGSYLRKYDSAVNVAIFEREVFPREHVGESLLPTTSHYLHELGVWDQVEAAGFPIKVGATYRWGRTNELWDFDFIADGKLDSSPRPGAFDGQRRLTSFQVDRGRYDEILLEHAATLGCTVRQNCRVSKVQSQGDRITGLELEDGESVQARYYIDASGNAGALRRALAVEVEYPTSLQNIAVWDYWENAEWAETLGIGGTRIQVLSVHFGWIWFVPLSPTRTSIGLVIPAEYYKQSKRHLRDLYRETVFGDQRVAPLIAKAQPTGNCRSTRDWSFLAKRMYGENWFLVGESGGFADPILSAGLTITHAAAREAAFTILELNRGEKDALWLKEEFQRLQVNRFRSHIRFADYWYSANEQFTDLKEHTQQIAAASGLNLSPEKAWQWLARGGFIDDDLVAGTGTLSLAAIRGLNPYLATTDASSPLEHSNIFKLNLAGAKLAERSRYERGRVTKYQAYTRDGKSWPLLSVYRVLFNVLKSNSTLPKILREMDILAEVNRESEEFRIWVLDRWPLALEALIAGGWVMASYDPKLNTAKLSIPTAPLRWHAEL